MESHVETNKQPSWTAPVAGWFRKRARALRRAAFFQELAHAWRVTREAGIRRGLGGLIGARWSVILGCARPSNWKRLKAYEAAAALATGRAAAFFLFYCAALASCSLATPFLFLAGQNAWAVATGAFALYSLQGVPVMLGQTLAYSAALPTPAMLAERAVAREETEN